MENIAMKNMKHLALLNECRTLGLKFPQPYLKSEINSFSMTEALLSSVALETLVCGTFYCYR